MKFLFSVFLLMLSVFVAPKIAFAVDCEGEPPKDNVEALVEYQKKCQEQIDKLQNEAKSLKATIGILNSKINLTNAQIRSTTEQIEKLEEEIKQLSGVIVGLNSTLDQLSVITAARVRETYMNRYTNPLVMFFTDHDYSALQSNLKYLAVLQKRDQIILNELETTRVDLDHQKTDKEIKQAEVTELKKKQEAQKTLLARQQMEKKQFLTETQNSEAKYQSLLAKALAELEAIENIIAGKGTEDEIRDVSQGEVIAKVEPFRNDGDYCNSSGPHLHFTLATNGYTLNPFKYLKQVDHIDNSGGDPFNPTGNWDWPINPTITFNQGYGETYAIRVYNMWYKTHNGIDIRGSSDEIKAVQAGKLYRGSYNGKTWKTNLPCKLKYVRVDHKDSDVDSYYLHVSYF